MKLIVFVMNKDLCHGPCMMGQKIIFMFSKNVCIIDNNIT